MVFVFGVDIPLVEMIFVLTLLLILLFGSIIYLIINQIKLHRLLRDVLNKENVELRNLKEVSAEEKKELSWLRFIRQELDKLIHGKVYGRRMEALLETKKARKRKTSRKKKGKTTKNKAKKKPKVTTKITRRLVKKGREKRAKKKSEEEGWVPFEEVKTVKEYK